MRPTRAISAGLLAAGVWLAGPLLLDSGVESAGQQVVSPADWAAFTAAVDRLVAVRHYRLVPNAPGEPTAFGPVTLPGANGDASFLLPALRSNSSTWRVAALRALGRLGEPTDVPTELEFLADNDPNVRAAASNALAESLRDVELPEAERWSSLVFRELSVRVLTERQTEVAVAMFGTLGQLRSRVLERQIQDTLIRGTLTMSPRPRDFAVRQMAALGAIEAFIRRNAIGSRVADDVRRRLRQLAAPGQGLDDDVGPVLPALQALAHAGDRDTQTIFRAATYRCAASRRIADPLTSARPDCGWEIRRLAFELIDPARPELATVVRQGFTDRSFRVRIAALEAHARDRSDPRLCAPFLTALQDTSIPVAIEATKLITPDCVEAAQAEAALRILADDLGNPSKTGRWHLPLAALHALVRFTPEAAKGITSDIASRHIAWQVRATAARQAAAFRDHELAFRLASDKEPNVRVEALLALRDLRSSDLARLSREALEPKDGYLPNYHVIATAAVLLRDVPNDVLVLPAVMRTLVTLNGQGRGRGVDESSRPARLALLEVVKESQDTGEAELTTLRLMFTDSDPVVARTAADIVRPRTAAVTEARPVIREPDLQTTTWPCVNIELERGATIGVKLELNEAPIGVRTFLRLVDQRFYDGTTFHRSYPDAYLQGGSPQASDYAGGRTLIRDELGPGHFARGTVGLVHNGRHAVNMQLLFSLVDAPHLDRNFTIIGTVGPCRRRDATADQMLDMLDAVRDGDRIVSINRSRDDSDEN